jgi:hypothetical protein
MLYNGFAPSNADVRVMLWLISLTSNAYLLRLIYTPSNGATPVAYLGRSLASSQPSSGTNYTTTVPTSL